jgi:hypothetical protein
MPHETADLVRTPRTIEPSRDDCVPRDMASEISASAPKSASVRACCRAGEDL